MPHEKQHHILIVEDNAEMAGMLQAYMNLQGYQTTTTPWGEAAVRLAAEQPCDLVLLDIRLPDIDGYQVYRRLQQQHRTRQIPVIFLTDRRARKDRLNGLELGAVDYVTKPFDIGELGLRVRNALQRARIPVSVNPVTDLPEGELVREQLAVLLEEPSWALVLVTIAGLDGFSQDQGFVAADDALRGLSALLAGTIAETDPAAELLGHLSPSTFVISTNLRRCRKLADNSQIRLQNAVPFFYPADPGGASPAAREAGLLDISVRCLTSADGALPDLHSLLATR